MNYEQSLTEKTFIPNIVIYFKGYYWGIRQPDSGLVIEEDRLCVEQVAINPTKVDPAKANTTINSYTFKLVDLNYAVTLLFNGITKFFQNEEVEIYIGRVGVDMAFSDYMKLPTTYVKKCSKDKNAYNFESIEAKDRLNRAAFDEVTKLEVDILVATTTIDYDGDIDTTIWPASGLLKVGDEFISYAAINTTTKRFTGCIRGEKNSIPDAHTAGDTIYLVTEVQTNPIDIILQCLISKGGGGIYDVLYDGAGLDESLVNITRFLEIRDQFFVGHVYNFLIYGVDNILKYIEEQILYPNELRIISDNTSKVSLAILNRRVFDDKIQLIDNDSLKGQPGFSVDDTNLINVVTVEYDYSEGTGKYRKFLKLEDADSIAAFGKRDPVELQLKGVLESLNGTEIATNIAQRFVTRFALPRPKIDVVTQMDKSLIQLAEKSILSSTQIPHMDTGALTFVDTVEVLERAINWKTGDVKFKFGFTSFTGIRECFLAPSDRIVTVTNQKKITVGAGRGALYTAGWKIRLYSDVTRDLVGTQINTIDTIVGDVITFTDNFVTTLTTDLRIMFPEYDDCINTTQNRYCFISDDGLKFNDNTKSYQITL